MGLLVWLIVAAYGVMLCFYAALEILAPGLILNSSEHIATINRDDILAFCIVSIALGLCYMASPKVTRSRRIAWVKVGAVATLPIARYFTYPPVYGTTDVFGVLCSDGVMSLLCALLQLSYLSPRSELHEMLLKRIAGPVGRLRDAVKLLRNA